MLDFWEFYVLCLIAFTLISPKEWVSCLLYGCGSPLQESSGRPNLPSLWGGSQGCPPGQIVFMGPSRANQIQVDTWKKLNPGTPGANHETNLCCRFKMPILSQVELRWLFMNNCSKGIVTSKPKRITWIILLRLWRSWPEKAGSLQGEAGIVEALVQEAFGGEVGFWEATEANEKIGLSLKGILRQKNFYRLNLIFWIVMGCGIAHFGRRGLKTT